VTLSFLATIPWPRGRDQLLHTPLSTHTTPLSPARAGTLLRAGKSSTETPPVPPRPRRCTAPRATPSRAAQPPTRPSRTGGRDHPSREHPRTRGQPTAGLTHGQPGPALLSGFSLQPQRSLPWRAAHPPTTPGKGHQPEAQAALV